MSGKWVTVQSKTNKRTKRKQEDTSDDDSSEDNYRPAAVRTVASAPSAPQKNIVQQIKAEERAAAIAAQRKEESRLVREAEKATRRTEAHRRALAQAASKRTVLASLLENMKPDTKTQKSFLSNVNDGLVGVAGAEQSSYLRALAVLSVFEKFFANVDIAELEKEVDEGMASEALMPMVALDSATDDVIAHLKPFVVFKGDGDGETMFNLVTECFGTKGAKEDCPLGQLYGLQLVIAANLIPALDSIGLIGGAFTAKGVKFHTLASFKNFLRVVDTIFFQLVSTPVARGSLLENATKRGMISLFRVLSGIQYDSIPKSFAWAHRVKRTVTDLHAILEDLGIDASNKEDKNVAPKPYAALAAPSDFEILNHLHSASAPVPVSPFLEELVMWHHPDTVRSSFPQFLALVDQELRTGKQQPPLSPLTTESLETVLHQALVYRPTEVFGSWGENFVKYPCASSLLTNRLVQNKCRFDTEFLQTVRQRSEKFLAVKRPESVETAALRAALAALSGKHVVAADMVSLAKEERKAAKQQQQGVKKNVAAQPEAAKKGSDASHKESRKKNSTLSCRNILISVVTIGAAVYFALNKQVKN